MKKIILLLCLILNIEPIFGGELVAHWDFDRLDGNRILDKSGKYPITVEGDLPKSLLKLGLRGQAFHFKAGKNRLSLPHGKAFNLTNDFTVALEMKPKDVDGFRAILWKGNRSTSPEIVNYAVDMRDGMLEFKYKNSSGQWIIHQTGKTIESEQWYHVVVYYNSGKCEIYINGEEKKVVHRVRDYDPIDLISGNYGCLIGRGQGPGNYETFFFTGLLDDLKIYHGRHIEIDTNYQEERSQLLKNYQHQINFLEPDLKVKN